MNEFEALEEIINKFADQMMRANKEKLTATNKTNAIEYLYRTPQVRLLQQALTELKAIKEAEPSEALEYLKSLDFQVRFMGILDIPSWEKYLPTIKQSLLKAEKLEKAWEIVKEKDVDFHYLSTCYFVGDYNYKVAEYMQLTQQEFDLLKEVLSND